MVSGGKYFFNFNSEETQTISAPISALNSPIAAKKKIVVVKKSSSRNLAKRQSVDAARAINAT